MARRKRVSVQGRGAELFFGDLPAATDATTDEDIEGASQAADSAPADEDARTQPEPVEPMQESKQANVAVAGTESRDELISSAILDAVWQEITEQATVTNAFRYTRSELAQLTDAIYELGKEHGTRVTKQEVARLGLNAILTDYQIRGVDSLLSVFIARRADNTR